ncbi:TPA: hypothetical protein ACIKQO_002904, partial [Enterococcus faecalis]
WDDKIHIRIGKGKLEQKLTYYDTKNPPLLSSFIELTMKKIPCFKYRLSCSNGQKNLYYN